MPYNGDTGQGATIAFGKVDAACPDIAVGCLRTVQLPEHAMDSIDASCLDDNTCYMKSIPADLADPGQIEATFVFNATDAVPEPCGCLYDVTVTLPIGNGDDPGVPNTTPATLQARGFFTSVQAPNLEMSTLMELTLVFKLDGYNVQWDVEAA